MDQWLFILMTITIIVTAVALVIVFSTSFLNKSPNINLLKDSTDIVTLVKALHYNRGKTSIEARQAAITALGKIGNPEAVEALILALDDSDQQVRESAALALGKTDNPDAAVALINRLSNPNLPADTTNTIKNALTQLGKTSVDPLLTALINGSPSIQAPIFEIMGNIKNRHTFEALLSGLESSEAPVRKAASDALVKIGTPILNNLISVLESGKTHMKVSAIEVLGKIQNPATIDAIVTLLKDPDQTIIEAAIDALDHLGWKPDREETGAIYWIAKERWDKCTELEATAIPFLLKRVQQPETGKDIQREISFALAQMGTPAVVPLISILEDSNPLLREISARVLGEINDPRAIDPLVQLLTDSTWATRRAAAQSLGKMNSQKAIDPLLKLLSDKEPEVRNATIVAIGQLGNKKAISPLLTTLLTEQGEIQKLAAEALTDLGWNPDFSEAGAAYWVSQGQWEKCITIGRPAVPILMSAMSNSRGETRKTIAKALVAIGDPRAKEAMGIHWIEEGRWDKCLEIGKETVPPLIEALSDKNNRIPVIKTLGKIGDTRAVKPLVSLLAEDDMVVREAVITALTKIGGPAEAMLIDIAQNGTEDTDTNIRLGAIEILGEMESKQAVKPLLEILQNQEGSEEPHIRKFTAETLGLIGIDAAIEPLMHIMNDDQEAWEVREATITALGYLKAKRALEPLLAMLEDWNQLGYLRKASALALGEIGSFRAMEPLLKAVKGKNNGRAAAEALGKIGNKAAVKPLIDMLNNDDEEVVSAAAHGLKKLTWQDYGTDKAQWDEWWLKQKP